MVAHYDYTSSLKSLFLLMYCTCRPMRRTATIHQNKGMKAVSLDMRMLKELEEKEMRADKLR